MTNHLLLVIETDRNVAMFSTHLKCDVIAICFVSDQENAVWTISAVLGLGITSFVPSTVFFSNLKTTLMGSELVINTFNFSSGGNVV